MRNNTIDIVKGLAIILMVIGHAEVEQHFHRFIYEFHMPVFFIAAGYFFSRKNLENPWDFCARRFKGLYVPMVKWSIVFLLLHNVFFHFGILNEQYGNQWGGVTHPYSTHAILQRLVHIVFSMAGYDEFMAGAFWFFRGLLVSSIVYLALYRMMMGRWKWLNGAGIEATICVLALLYGAFSFCNGLRITTIVQGGIRETWGVMFFGLGVIYRRYEARIGHRMWLTLLCAGFLAAGSFMNFHGMNLTPKPIDLLTLPLSGMAGFVMIHHISSAIDNSNGIARRFLIFCGQNTLYVFVFHIICFKIVSLLKIWWYGLDFAQIGCHMVIHYRHADDGFWVLYTIAGVGLPLLGVFAKNKIKSICLNKRQKI